MIKLFFLYLVKIYQIISHIVFPLPKCRFYPSCSVYTYQAIEEFGIAKGVFLGIKRLLKCHPFHPGGYDPLWKNE